MKNKATTTKMSIRDWTANSVHAPAYVARVSQFCQRRHLHACDTSETHGPTGVVPSACFNIHDVSSKMMMVKSRATYFDLTDSNVSHRSSNVTIFTCIFGYRF
jgi:hypothetical protein